MSDSTFSSDQTDLDAILKGVNRDTEVFRFLEAEIEMINSLTDGGEPNKNYRELLDLVRNGKVRCILFLPNSPVFFEKLVDDFVEAGIEVVVMSEGDTVDDFPGLDSTRRMQILHPNDD